MHFAVCLFIFLLLFLMFYNSNSLFFCLVFKYFIKIIKIILVRCLVSKEWWNLNWFFLCLFIYSYQLSGSITTDSFIFFSFNLLILDRSQTNPSNARSLLSVHIIHSIAVWLSVNFRFVSRGHAKVQDDRVFYRREGCLSWRDHCNWTIDRQYESFNYISDAMMNGNFNTFNRDSNFCFYLPLSILISAVKSFLHFLFVN